MQQIAICFLKIYFISLCLGKFCSGTLLHDCRRLYWLTFLSLTSAVLFSKISLNEHALREQLSYIHSLINLADRIVWALSQRKSRKCLITATIEASPPTAFFRHRTLDVSPFATFWSHLDLACWRHSKIPSVDRHTRSSPLRLFFMWTPSLRYTCYLWYFAQLLHRICKDPCTLTLSFHGK